MNRTIFFRALLGACVGLACATGAMAQPAATPKAAPTVAPKAAPAVAPATPAAPAPAAPTTANPTVAAPAAGAPATAAAPTDPGYVLGVADVVQVSLLGRTDFDAHGRIGNDGDIILPYIGAVHAIGRSTAQLASDIRAALIKGGYYENPMVHVEVSTVGSRYVTVLGAVGTPGLIPLDREYRLSELIARVGGRGASGADYAVLTRPDGTTANYNLAALATAGKDKDPLLVAGDKVYVPAAENEVFYLTGQVRAPGAFPVTPGMTVRMALARGGGVNENGNENKVKIIRKGVPLKDVKLDVTTVEPGDVLTIGERLF